MHQVQDPDALKTQTVIFFSVDTHDTQDVWAD